MEILRLTQWNSHYKKKTIILYLNENINAEINELN